MPNETPKSFTQQWDDYRAAMEQYRREMDRYDQGERTTPPPRPVPPHTPGHRR